MRNLLIVVLLVVVSGLPTAVSADSATITILPGDNWVAAPIVPFDPAPESVFGASLGQCSLKRFDATTQTEVLYGSPAFGLILLGDGYKIHNPTQTTFYSTYSGVPDGVPDGGGIMTDMWVALPGNGDTADAGGMHWVGQPFYHDTDIATGVLLTDGTRMMNMQQAIAEGWIDGLWNYMDAESQAVRTAGLSSLGAYDTNLRALHMYEIRTHKDNLALIILAEPVPEPSALACTLLGLVAFSGWRLRRRI